MLPSLCPVMAAIPPVSRFPVATAGGRASNQQVYLPLAGSIGTRIVARLYSEWPLRGRLRTALPADCRRAPGRWRACRQVDAGRSRQWQAPARKVRCSDER